MRSSASGRWGHDSPNCRGGVGRASPDEARTGPSAALEKLAELTALHLLLQELLDAVGAFEAGSVAALRRGHIDAVGRTELFVNWRPCQIRINHLVEFSEGVRHIGRPYRRETHQLHGARWAVEIVALQLMIEDTLADQSPLPGALVELVDDLQSACHRHLAIANREMRSLVPNQQPPDALRRQSA